MHDYFVVFSIVSLLVLFIFTVFLNLFVTAIWCKEWYSGNLDHQFKLYERILGVPVMLFLSSFLVIYYYIERCWKAKYGKDN